MKNRFRAFVILSALATAAHASELRAQVSAEHLFRPGSVALSVYGGGAAFSPFRQGAVRPVDGTLEFQRRVSAHTSPAVGADLQWWLNGRLGVRAHASWLPSRFDVQFDAVGTDYVRRAAGGEEPEWKRLDIFLADISALIRPPLTFGRVAPYAIVGGGVASYRPRGDGPLPAGTERAFADGPRTAVAGVLGLGAAIPLQRKDLILSFAVTNHIARSPLADADRGDAGEGPSYDLVMGEISADEGDRAALASNVRLMVGLTVPIRRVR
jgi:hypothetical protein